MGSCESLPTSPLISTPRLPSTPRPTEKSSSRSSLKPSTLPPPTCASRPSSPCTLPVVPPVSSSTSEMVSLTPSPSMRVTPFPTPSCVSTGRTRLDRLPHEDHVRERLFHGHHCRARDCPRYQGEALLCRSRLRAGDGHRRLLLLHREVLRASRRSDRHRRQRAFPLPRVHVPPRFPRYGGCRHS